MKKGRIYKSGLLEIVQVLEYIIKLMIVFSQLFSTSINRVTTENSIQVKQAYGKYWPEYASL